MANHHPQIACFNPWELETIWIDKEIAPLVQTLWNMGIRTINSCQENQPNSIWIEFLTSLDFENFLNAAIPSRDGELWESAHIHWDLRVNVNDIAHKIDKGEVIYQNPHQYAVYVSARFPKNQYPEILRRGFK